MEKLPSRLIIAKKTDGADTRLAQLDQPLITNPLEKFLGAHQFGTYDQNKDGKDYAFVRIEDLWQEEVDNDSDDGADTDDAPEPQIPEEASNPPMDITAERSRTTQAPPTQPILPGQRPQRQRKRPQKYVENAYDHTTTKLLQDLRKSIQKSNHKGFFIKNAPSMLPNQPQWTIVTVDSTQSDPRLMKEGRYRVREWRPREEDAAKRLRRNCRYIPHVVSRRTRQRVNVRPQKVEATIKNAPQGLEWIHIDVDLYKQGLVGPFEFVHQHNICQKVWSAFEKQAEEKGIDTHPANAIEPI
jgi:hypothetical protein